MGCKTLGTSKYAIPAPTNISQTIRINIKIVIFLNSMEYFDLIKTKYVIKI
jgi:hypothetical protein